MNRHQDRGVLPSGKHLIIGPIILLAFLLLVLPATTSAGFMNSGEPDWTLLAPSGELSPSIPELLAPANGSSTSNPFPVFTWNASAGASGYQIQIDNQGDFSSPTFDQFTATTSFTPTSALAHMTYFWHVRASDSLGDWSVYSAPWRVTIADLVCATPGAPVLIAPLDGDTVNDATPTFDWDTLADSSEYQLQVDNNSDFSSPIIDISLAASAYTPLAPLVDNLYYWRVRGRNTAGGCDVDGPWSNHWTVTINSLVCNTPGATSLVAPAYGSLTNLTTPAFDWDAATGANEHQFQLDMSGDFSSPVISLTITASQYTPVSALPDNLYFWRARGRNHTQVCDVSGAWSATWNVMLDTIPPAVPQLVEPSNGISTDNATPAFSWVANGDAIEYQIQLDNNDDFFSPEHDHLIDTASFTPTTTLANGTTFWRVRAHDAAVNWSEYSAVWSVVIDVIQCVTPGIPHLSSPSDGASIDTSTPEFDWSQASDATSYRIQVDHQSDFPAPLVDLITDTSSYSSTLPLDDGVYYWHVRGQNGSPGCTGSKAMDGPWSITNSFLITTTQINESRLYLPLLIR